MIHVTASVGGATLDDAHRKNDLIAVADAALDEAKRSGKNRTRPAAHDAAAPAGSGKR